MDPLSHALVGGLAAKTFGVSKRRFWAMCFMGMAPDLDFLAQIFWKGGILFHHHGLTHSLLGILPQALLFSLLLKKWDAGPFWRRTFHYACPVALHILGDLATNFGVQLFSPFNGTFYSWEVLGGLNVVPLLMMIVALGWMHRKRRQGGKVTSYVWGAWIVYFGFVFLAKVDAVHLSKRTQENLVVLPTLSNPFRWRGIHVDSERSVYEQYSIDLLRNKTQWVRTVSMPGSRFPVEASRKAPLVARFLTNHRWPVARVTPHAEGWSVEWGEIMFSVRGMIRGHVSVDVDREGRLKRGKNIYTFWTPS